VICWDSDTQHIYAFRSFIKCSRLQQHVRQITCSRCLSHRRWSRVYIYVPAQLAADVKMSNILPISSYICAPLHCFLWQSSLQNLAAQESTVNTANTGFTAAWNDVSLVFMRCGIINMHILESNSWILIQFQTICYISFLAQKSAYSSIMQTLKLYLEHKQNGEHQLECYFSCRS